MTPCVPKTGFCFDERPNSLPLLGTVQVGDGRMVQRVRQEADAGLFQQAKLVAHERHPRGVIVGAPATLGGDDRFAQLFQMRDGLGEFPSVLFGGAVAGGNPVGVDRVYVYKRI